MISELRELIILLKYSIIGLLILYLIESIFTKIRRKIEFKSKESDKNDK